MKIIIDFLHSVHESLMRFYFSYSQLQQKDEKTKEEFLLWMTRFPHLRITGTKLHFPIRNQMKDLATYDEIIAIDPPLHEPYKMLEDKLEYELSEKLTLRKARQPQTQIRSDDLEKLLRITSSSGLSRNFQQQTRPNQSVTVRKVDRTSTFLVKQNSVGLNFKKLSKIQENKRIELSPILIQREILQYEKSPLIKSIKSAQLNKMSNPSDHQKLPKNEFSFSKSASIHKKNLNNIQLPPFDISYPFDLKVRGKSNQYASRIIHKTYNS